MIKVENLHKSYDGKAALNGLSFTAKKGELLGLLGVNGAGKSSCMRILTSAMPPTSGTASVGGFNCATNPMDVRRLIGYLPETAPLYSEMRVQELLSFVADVKQVGSHKQQQISSVMESTGLLDVRRNIIGKLSRGYRQRVGLAQALLGNPELLVLDEPTAGLDPKQIVEIRNLIKSLKGERTILLSTHMLQEAELLCDRVAIINSGKLVALEKPEDLEGGLEKFFMQIVVEQQ